MSQLSEELIQAAYKSLDSGDVDQARKYYTEDVRWLIPGDHQVAGWHEGIEAFLGVLTSGARLTGDTFRVEREALFVGEDLSVGLSRYTGVRAGSPTESTAPQDRLDVEALHLLRWRDGKVYEREDFLSGDDARAYSQFWSPRGSNGTRREP